MPNVNKNDKTLMTSSVMLFTEKRKLLQKAGYNSQSECPKYDCEEWPERPFQIEIDFFKNLMYQSILNTNIPPRADPREFVKVVKFPGPEQKIVAKLRPRGTKIDKTPPLGTILWTFKTILL